MPLDYKQNVRAPDFGRNDVWLNTDKPLRLSDLRGKVVLIDFWTYCCINCMHVLPKLHELEQEYGDSLVVIGVHSAKFEDEGDTDNIRQAILRYDIQHPVVNDRDFRIWRSYAVQAWPTMVLIDPEGYIVDKQSGEGGPEYFKPMIGQLARGYASKGKLDTTPLDLVLEKNSLPPSLLEFPGKVTVDDAGNRLFISDSNHNRIIVADLTTGNVQEVIGSGNKGLANGDFAEAAFNNPQGTALVGDLLYIADTQNHVIRAADLKKKSVTTVAGTGKQGGYGAGTSPALTTALSSPWDVTWDNPRLYIAMAGPHQIWFYDPAKDDVGVWAGSGRENLIDGGRLFAALAQPSGITTDGKRLYFADSEVSAVRTVELTPDGLVNTIVGQGLFDFGDKDGKGTEVRLQHPLGIDYHDHLLYVADTYNNKIKLVNPPARTSRTFAGNGKGGYVDGRLMDAEFDEPGGLSVAADGRIYVADTNNHLVRVVDPAADTVGTFELTGLQKMMPESKPDSMPAIELHAQSVHPGLGTLRINLSFPKEYKLNPEGGIQVAVSGRPGVVTTDLRKTFATSLPVDVQLRFSPGMGDLDVTLDYVYCRKDNTGLCYFGNAHLKLPLNVTDAATDNQVTITHKVEDPGM